MITPPITISFRISIMILPITRLASTTIRLLSQDTTAVPRNGRLRVRALACAGRPSGGSQKSARTSLTGEHASWSLRALLQRLCGANRSRVVCRQFLKCFSSSLNEAAVSCFPMQSLAIHRHECMLYHLFPIQHPSLQSPRYSHRRR